MSRQGTLDEQKILEIIKEQKAIQKSKIVFSEENIAQYFPRGYTPKQMEDIMMKLLVNWHRARQERER